MKKLTEIQRAELQAKLVTLERSITELHAKESRSAEDTEALLASEKDKEIIEHKLQVDDLLVQRAERDAIIAGERNAAADKAVQAAMARGAILAKDTANQDRWKKLCAEDPDTYLPMLAAMRGSSAFERPRVQIQAVQISREANGNVLRGMSELIARNSQERYAAKARTAKEFAAIYAREILPRLKEGDEIPLILATETDSLGTLAASITSVRTLELLTLSFPTLTAIATNFSDEIVSYGDTLKTRFVGIPTVQTYSPTTGWTKSGVTTTDVPITYDQFKGVPISLDAQTIAGTVRRLFDEIAPAQAYALGKNVVDYVYSKITAAAFPGVLIANSSSGAAIPTIAIAAGGFGRPTVIDMGGALDDNKNPDMGRTLVLNRLYRSALAKDNAIITLAAFQNPEIIRQGTLPDVEGFQVIKAVNLPATDIGGNTLKGFGFTKSALCLATRLAADYIKVLPGANNGNLTVITTPSGISANQVQFVNHDMGTANQRMDLIFGASAGQPDAGIILTDV